MPIQFERFIPDAYGISRHQPLKAEQESSFDSIDLDLRKNPQFIEIASRYSCDPQEINYRIEKDGTNYWIRLFDQPGSGQRFAAGDDLKKIIARFYGNTAADSPAAPRHLGGNASSVPSQPPHSDSSENSDSDTASTHVPVMTPGSDPSQYLAFLQDLYRDQQCEIRGLRKDLGTTNQELAKLIALLGAQQPMAPRVALDQYKVTLQEGEITYLKNAVARLEKELESLKKNQAEGLSPARDKNAEIAQELDQKKSELGTAHQAHADALAAVTALQAQLAAHVDLQKELTQRNSELQASLTQAIGDLDGSRAELAASSKEHASEIEKICKANDDALAEIKGQVQNLQNEFAQKLADAEVEKQKLMATAESWKNEADEASSGNAQLTRELDKQISTYNELLLKFGAAETEMDQLRADFAGETAEKSDLLKDLRDQLLESTAKLLTQSNESLEEHNNDIAELEIAHDLELKEKQADLEAASQALDQALQNVTSLSAQLDAAEKSSDNLLNKSRERTANNLQFQQDLIKKQAELEAAKDQVERQVAEHTSRIASLESQLTEAQDNLIAFTAKLNASSQVIEDQKEQIQSHLSELANLQMKKSELENELEKEKHLSAVNISDEKASLATIASLESQIEQLEAEHTARIESLQEHIDTLIMANDASYEEVKKLQHELTESLKKINEAEQRLMDQELSLNFQANKGNAEKARWENLLDAQKSAYEHLELELEAAKTAMTQLREEHTTSMKTAAVKMKTLNATHAAEILELGEEITKIFQEFQNEKTLLGELLDEEIAKNQKLINEHSNEIEDLQIASALDLKEMQNESTQKQDDLAIRIASLEAQLASAEEKAASELEASLSEALEQLNAQMDSLFANAEQLMQDKLQLEEAFETQKTLSAAHIGELKEKLSVAEQQLDHSKEGQSGTLNTITSLKDEIELAEEEILAVRSVFNDEINLLQQNHEIEIAKLNDLLKQAEIIDEGRIEDSENAHAQFKKEIGKISKDLHSVSQAREEALQNVADLSAQLTAANARNGHFEKTLEETSEKISRLENESAKKQVELADALKKTADLDASKDQAERQVAEHASRIASLEAQLNAAKNEQAAEIPALTQRNSELTAKLDEAQGNLKASTDALEELKVQMESHFANTAQLEQDNINLENALETQQTQVSILEDEIELSEIKLDELMNSFKSQIDQLQKDHKREVAALNTLIAEDDILEKSNIEEYQKAYEQFDMEIRNAHIEKTQLLKELENLNLAYAERWAELGKAQAERDELKETHKEARSVKEAQIQQLQTDLTEKTEEIGKITKDLQVAEDAKNRLLKLDAKRSAEIAQLIEDQNNEIELLQYEDGKKMNSLQSQLQEEILAHAKAKAEVQSLTELLDSALEKTMAYRDDMEGQLKIAKEDLLKAEERAEAAMRTQAVAEKLLKMQK